MEQKATYTVEKAIFTLIKDSNPLSYNAEFYAHAKNINGELEEVIINCTACF